MYDTILTLKNRRKTCCVFLTTVLRRFFSIFLYLVHIADIQCDTYSSVFLLHLFAAKNRAKRLQNSQSGIAGKSILQSQ